MDAVRRALTAAAALLAACACLAGCQKVDGVVIAKRQASECGPKFASGQPGPGQIECSDKPQVKVRTADGHVGWVSTSQGRWEKLDKGETVTVVVSDSGEIVAIGGTGS